MRLFALAAISIIALGCRGPAAEPETAGGAANEIAQRDAMWAEEVAKGEEARMWLARQDTRLFEISKEAGTELVEAVYGAGAVNVTMVDSGKLSDDSPVEVGATFIAELPVDPEARKKVFSVYREYYEEERKDEGQKYLPFSTD